MTKPVGAKNYFNGVVNYIEQRPNVEVSLYQITKALSLNEKQVRYAMNKLRKDPHEPGLDGTIRVVKPGRAWRFIPRLAQRAKTYNEIKEIPSTNHPAKIEAQIDNKPKGVVAQYRSIGRDHDDNPLMMDDDGVVYVVKPI